MSSLTSITNAVGDAALPFWLLIQSEPLAEQVCENEVQLLNSKWRAANTAERVYAQFSAI